MSRSSLAARNFPVDSYWFRTVRISWARFCANPIAPVIRTSGGISKLGGKYVCIDRTTVGKSLTSEFDIADASPRFFERDEILPVSGIAIGIDAKGAKGDGSAKAFVKRIELLQ